MQGDASLASAVGSAEFPRSTPECGQGGDSTVPPSSFVLFGLQVYCKTDLAIPCYKAAPLLQRRNYLSLQQESHGGLHYQGSEPCC